MKLPDWLRQTLATFEQTAEAHNEAQIGDAVNRAVRNQTEMSDEERVAAAAEAVAFFFYERPDEDSVWGTYFAPMMTATKQDGTPFYSPDIADLDERVVSHWEARATSVQDPVMKARYADLVWDLKKVITRKPPSPEYARMAIDAYVEATQKALYPMDIEGVQWLQRALSLSLKIRDRHRKDKVVEFMFEFYDRVANPRHIGVWIFLFDTLYGRKDLITPEQEARIISNLETMLNATSAPSTPAEFNPFGAEAAAERLSRHYEKQKDKTASERVIKAYGESFERVAREASPMLAISWLPPIIERYKRLGLKQDAERLQRLMEEKGKQIAGEMKSFSAKVEFKKEDIDKLIESLTSGDLASSVARIAAYFIPDVAATKDLLEKLRKEAPLSSLIPITRVEDGRPTAKIGSIDEDAEGRLHNQLAQTIQFYQPFLALALDRLRERHKFTTEDILGEIYKSPIFEENRRELLKEGLAAYESGDFLKAIHVLVPQIEHALRHLLALLGIPIIKAVRTQPGIMDAKSMNDVLIEERARAALTENLWRYLVVFYVDRRGFNLRNNLAHGLVDMSAFNRYIADRVFHTLLALSLIRNTQE